MVYDGDGNRASKTVSGITTTYLVDTQNPTGYAQVLQENFTGNTGANYESLHTYVYGLERISERRNYVANNQGATANAYYVYDGHGSVGALADSTGTVTDTYDYDAFGVLLHSTGTTPNNYLYSGEQYDPDLHLYYNRARYLNSSSGRFWSADILEGDTFQPKSLHRYTYASNNPVNAADPSGYEDATLAEISFTALLYISLASIAVLSLSVACRVGATLGSGKGPCGTSPNQKQGKIRIQVQLGYQFTVPNTPVLPNDDPPGVTILQARAGLGALLPIVQSSPARFPYNANENDFFTAVIELSQEVATFAPYGVTGLFRSTATAPIGDSGWRIDIDNLQGTNLRQ